MTPPSQDIPERGDIFYADIPEGESVGSEQRGRRPVLVVSVNIINSNLPVCVVIPLSKQLHKKNRQHRILISESEKIQSPNTGGCKGDSLVLTEQIRMISRDRLDPKKIAKLKPMGLGAVEAGMKYILGLP